MYSETTLMADKLETALWDHLLSLTVPMSCSFGIPISYVAKPASQTLQGVTPLTLALIIIRETAMPLEERIGYCSITEKHPAG